MRLAQESGDHDNDQFNVTTRPRGMSQKAVGFPATPEEIDREMLTPPHNMATEDSDTEMRRHVPAVDTIYEEEAKGASFSRKNPAQA